MEGFVSDSGDLVPEHETSDDDVNAGPTLPGSRISGHASFSQSLCKTLSVFRCLLSIQPLDA
jgi:hypothetical protein